MDRWGAYNALTEASNPLHSALSKLIDAESCVEATEEEPEGEWFKELDSLVTELENFCDRIKKTYDRYERQLHEEG